MGGGEGRQEQAEEEIQRELSGAMGVPEHGGESTVGSSGALCHYRSHQYCKSLSLIYFTEFSDFFEFSLVIIIMFRDLRCEFHRNAYD